MYARHDLAWLSGEGWNGLLATTPGGTPAHAAIARWAGADWPLIVRRCEAADGTGENAGDACLGLAAPPDPASGAKLRLPLRLSSQHIVRHRAPLQLDAVAHALPARWQASFGRLAEACAGLDLRVFGSLALQALTGQPYLRDASDIDLLFRPCDAAELEKGLRLLASFLDELPLDGEIVFPNGHAVAWKEWLAADDHSARVLVKSQASVMLCKRADLRAELEPA